MVNQRLQQGQVIAQSCEIRKTSENTWLVPSQSGNGIYEVTKLGNETYACTCKDFEYRTHMVGNCKHCFALDYYLQLQVKVIDDVDKQLVEQTATPEDITLCPDCKSPSVIHYGERGKRVVKQIMLCKDCGRQFRKQEDAFTKLQSEPRIISLLVSMHCRNV